MCLILVAYRASAEWPLVVLANRDEMFARPAAPAAFWSDAPAVFAGRDLEKGGTWLGATRDGRLACVTNVRSPSARREGKSRGALVADFLKEPPRSALDYAEALTFAAFPSFNALFFDGDALVSADDEGRVVRVSEGFHGLSNARLDTRWPKVETGTRALRELVESRAPLEAGFEILGSRALAEDTALPSTGVPRDLERSLSSAFIHALLPAYGTRCSTVVRFDREKIEVIERTFDATGAVSGEVRESVWIKPCISAESQAP